MINNYLKTMNHFFKNEEVEMGTRYRERAVSGNTIDFSIYLPVKMISESWHFPVDAAKRGNVKL